MPPTATSPHRRRPNDDRDRQYYEQECRRFRICIIGKAGVGKTTLLSRVFGIDEAEAGVVRQSQAVRNGGGCHNIFTPIVDETRNSALVIHDSCGFEAGEENNLNEVKSFIVYRSEMPSLQEQLHCIWYCIDLVDSRPFHKAERELFRFLRDQEIPLVFVLTKYDACLNEKIMDVAENIRYATEADWHNAEMLARNHIAEVRGYLEDEIGNGVKVQEVSKSDVHLVQRLVVETTAIVRPNLRIVWFRAQGVLAQQKRVACIDWFPKKLLESLIRNSSLPFNPFRGMQLADFFKDTFTHCLMVWNLPGQSVLFAKDYIQTMFYEASQSYITAVKLSAVFDILGFLDAPRYIKFALQIACDLIMIFQQLFWATPRRHKLSRGDLRRELDNYRRSGIRDTIHRMVDGEVHFGNSFQWKKLVGIIRVVVNDGSRILHAETVRSHKRGEVVSFDEPPFAELPAQD